MPTVINDGECVEVEAELGGRWLMQSAAFEELTGWAVKPQGLCRGDVCAPIRRRDMVISTGGLIDLAQAAPVVGMAAVADVERGVAALGASAAVRAREMTSLRASDFTLANLRGDPVSLHDFQHRKVVLLAWSSW